MPTSHTPHKRQGRPVDRMRDKDCAPPIPNIPPTMIGTFVVATIVHLVCEPRGEYYVSHSIENYGRNIPLGHTDMCMFRLMGPIIYVSSDR